MANQDGRELRDAWLAAVFSARGPRATVRLVLATMAPFMDFDRPRTFVGVRRLAENSGLNKDTVTQAISEAERGGWLVIAARTHGSRREMTAQIPPRDVSEQHGQSGPGEVSEESGQSTAAAVRALSESTGATVRIDESNCPSGSDRPSLTSSDPRPACAREGDRQDRLMDAVAMKWIAGVRHIDSVIAGLPSDLRAGSTNQLRDRVWQCQKRLRAREANHG